MFSVELTSVIGSSIFFIAWLVRMEAKTNQNERDVKFLSKNLEKQQDKHDSLDQRIVEKLSIIERSLATIEGQLRSINKE